MHWSYFTKSLIAASLTICVTIAAVVVAIASKENGATEPALTSPAERQANTLWASVVVLLDNPVDPLSLQETDSVAGRWIDVTREETMVDGIVGTMVITRDFGSTEDVDARQLLQNVAPRAHAITVGFRPVAAHNQRWFWARFAADGKVARTADGDVLAGYFAGVADQRCIAAGWHAMTTS